MRNLLIAFFLFVPSLVMAAGGAHLDHAPIDLTDTDSLKRGAKSFASYCLSCHSAEYMRYNRIGSDLGMTDVEVAQDLVSTRDAKGEKTKIGELMKVAMTEDYAKQAFGTKIPGLSVIARAKGADYLYTYLRTFYLDDSRPTGMNNIAFADVGMPHVLWELQGLQKANYKTETDADGNEKQVFVNMEMVKPGKLSKEEYDAFVADLVNFMVYMGEPVQLERKSLGIKVLIFLFILAILAYLLKKEYWKDIH
ncbi:MAG: cytochrome c1 [Gammaproteobacteria bacterium]|nr:cytochrome c1 [Gammaproteobacteria bacterium]MCW8910548.1 cytochrome c1 [Gammaproteobacteria bacterium]MCW9004119.1 cytochrome c1 [Gammaproteobacteria bacterium]MCW9055230.1 cytochrome c1 [Gammaproteobacteria bacterium]